MARRRGGNPSLNAALALLLLCRLCGSFAGPVHVDPHVTAVWGKNITLKCLIEVNETITQISWERIIGKGAQTIAVHHPIYGTSFEESYQQRTTFKNTSLHDATIVINNIEFSDAGEYICKAVTFPLGNVQSSTTVTVFVEPTVSISKGPEPLLDGGNETVAAYCTAATGKPAAEVSWEGSLGRMETNVTSYPNKTVTVMSQYRLVPSRFARGRNITCVVKHPALENDIRYPFTLDIQYAPEVSITGYDDNWFVGRTDVYLKCNSDANPSPTEIKWTRLDGIWPEGLQSVNNTLLFSLPLTHNVSGIYACKVANALGQKSDQKIITILDHALKDTSSLTAAEAVIGVVLAVFFITIFVTVFLTPKRKQAPFFDTMNLEFVMVITRLLWGGLRISSADVSCRPFHEVSPDKNMKRSCSKWLNCLNSRKEGSRTELPSSHKPFPASEELDREGPYEVKGIKGHYYSQYV